MAIYLVNFDAASLGCLKNRLKKPVDAPKNRAHQKQPKSIRSAFQRLVRIPSQRTRTNSCKILLKYMGFIWYTNAIIATSLMLC